MKELTPFSTSKIITNNAAIPDPTAAKEIAPLMRFGMLLPGAPPSPQVNGNFSPNHQSPVSVVEEKAAETPAEDDPKVVVSSVTDNASLSPSGIGENGKNETEMTHPIHPSTLPVIPESPASAVKDLNLLPLL
jgi:hypothetical protein